MAHVFSAGRSRSVGSTLVALAGLASVGLVSPAVAQVQWKATPDRPLVIESQRDVEMRLRNLGVEGRGVVQLERAITDSGRELLRSRGMTLLAPLGNNAFFFVLDATPQYGRLAKTGWIRGVAAIETAWKIDPRLTDENVLALWGQQAEQAGQQEGAGMAAGAGNDPMIPVYVHLHQDKVADAASQAMVERHATRVTGALQAVPVFTLELPQSKIQELALEPWVQFIEPAMPALDELNAQNRVRTGADMANASPFNLNGAGVSVLVFDSGNVRTTHQTFGGRATIIDTGDSVSSHSTHCAGTVGGSGAGSMNSMHAGMAPGVQILSAGFAGQSLPSGWLYTNPVDIEVDYTVAVAAGADIATNSIGTNVVFNGFPCSWHGDYNATDILIDAMVRGSQTVSQGNPFRIVWAAGNERGGLGTCGNVPYRYIGPPAGSKNHLCIGSVDSDTDNSSSFSSWGPTDDGRMKPDFSAPGCQAGGDTGVTSSTAGGDTEYSSLCGTSMATPTLAGLSALFMQDFRAQFPLASDPRNSTLKAIFAHTAVDRGRPGPDFEFGYGSARIMPAIELMRDGRFDEFGVTQDETRVYTVTVPEGQERFAVTIAWDDVPGTVNAIPVLVNDIDIEVLGPDATYLPWTLDPAAPANNAVRTSQNRRDNLEQVSVSNPPPGQYVVRISGFNVPGGGTQPVSIASTHGIAFSGSLPLVRLEPVDLADELVGPGSSQQVTLRARVFQDTLVAGSVLVHYSKTGPDGPFQQIPMTQGSDGNWNAMLPAVRCEDDPAYFFSATGQTVGTVTLPESASQKYAFDVGVYVAFANDAMEAPSGWSLALPTDNATGGRWERGDPQATTSSGVTIQPEDDTTANPGRFCYVTAAIAGSGAGAYDLDGGTTTATTPAFDVSGRASPRVQYQRWYTNGVGLGTRDDVLVVQVSYDNGATWQVLETLGTGGARFDGGWVLASHALAQSSAQTRLRFIASDLGAGHLVEALVDDLSISELECVNPPRTCDSIDFNNDGATFDPTDIDAFLSVYSEGPCIPGTATCNDIDFNNDGATFDPTDIDSFLSVFSEGPCL